MSMPERPRPHVLEEESFQALQGLLPSAWTVTRVQPDYGVDALVEIFDQKKATGLVFGVQLKGTDEPDLRQALKKSFQVSSLNYLYERSEPALLVRYHAPTGSLFGRWLHSKDIYLTREQQKTVTITWQPSEELNAESSEDLQDAVRRFRRFHDPVLGPLTLCLVLFGAWEQSRTEILTSLGSLLRAGDGGLVLSDRGPYDVKVELTDDSMWIDLSVTSIHATEVSAETPVQVAANIAAGVATCLARLGRHSAAASLTSATYGTAPLLENEDVASLLAPTFGSAGRWREASDLATSSMLEDDVPAALGSFLLADLMIRSSQIPRIDTPHVAENLVRVARQHDENDDDRAGAAWYSAGNFLFNSVHDYPKALEAYERAAVVCPDYLDQVYYLAETAAAKFENGKYQDAAQLYEQAAGMGEGSEFLARQADSLAYAGCRERAIALFRTYEEASPEPRPAWLLKRAALEYLDSIDDEPAVRSKSEATAAANVYETIGLKHVARLCDLTQAGDAHAMLQFLTVACAFPAKEAAPTWAVFLRLAHALGDSWTFTVAVHAAWGLYGEDLVPIVLGEVIPDLGPSDFAQVFQEEISRARNRLVPPVTFRFLHDDGTRDVMTVSDEDGHVDMGSDGGGG